MIGIYYQILNNPAYSDRHNAGRALLSRLLQDCRLAGHYPLSTLKISPAGKPYFESGIDFSIAHSGSLVACTATRQGKVGIDAEYIKPVVLALYEDYFSAAEWRQINGSIQPEAAFYRLWVRKEAVMKATGRGVFLPMHEIDVLTDKVSAAGSIWYLQDVQAHNDYAVCIAADVPYNARDIQLHKIDEAE